MKNCTVYYDDVNKRCRQYAEELENYPNVECRKISEYKEKSNNYEPNEAVGFIFHSGYGRIDYEVKRIIWRITIPKNSYIFLVVADGGREMDAIRSAAKEFEERGHHVTNVYSEYFFDKYHVTDPTKKILDDMQKGESLWRQEQEKVNQMNRKELRHHLKENLKSYRDYKKRKKHKKNRP